MARPKIDPAHKMKAQDFTIAPAQLEWLQRRAVTGNLSMALREVLDLAMIAEDLAGPSAPAAGTLSDENELFR